MFQGRALWDHEIDEVNSRMYLPFKEGDIITIIKQKDDAWWLGSLGDKEGLFPYSYIEVITNNSTKDAYQDFVALLVHSELKLVEALAETVDGTHLEPLAKDLATVFDNAGKILCLLEWSISKEIHRTTSSGTLFRNNSLATHLIVSYARLIGKQFLINTLKPLLELLIFSDQSYEIDPSKVENETMVATHLQQLSTLAQNLMQRMISCVEICPKTIRHICYYLQQKVTPKFPESKTKVIGGFFFLRFISPAIVSPEGFGIVKQPVSISTRRTLVLISKVLQSVANGVQFGAKESFMTPMNEFVKDSIDQLHNFFNDLAKENFAQAFEEVSQNPLPEEKLKEVLEHIHLLLSMKFTKVTEYLQTESPQTLTQLNAILQQLPPPKSGRFEHRVNTVETPLQTRRDSAKVVLNGFLENKMLPKVKRKVVYENSRFEQKQEPKVITLKGFLLKKGLRGVVKSYKKRYFVKDGTKIHYFLTPEDTKPKGSIPLDANFSVQKTKNLEFRLKTGGRSWELAAFSEEELKYWVNGLLELKTQLDKKVVPVPPPSPKFSQQQLGSSSTNLQLSQSQHSPRLQPKSSNPLSQSVNILLQNQYHTPIPNPPPSPTPSHNPSQSTQVSTSTTSSSSTPSPPSFAANHSQMQSPPVDLQSPVPSSTPSLGQSQVSSSHSSSESQSQSHSQPSTDSESVNNNDTQHQENITLPPTKNLLSASANRTKKAIRTVVKEKDLRL